MSRRNEIELTAAEQLELLDSERVVVISTNGPRGWLGDDAVEALQSQAPKRVAIRFEAVRTASWDDRKLGGTY